MKEKTLFIGLDVHKEKIAVPIDAARASMVKTYHVRTEAASHRHVSPENVSRDGIVLTGFVRNGAS